MRYLSKFAPFGLPPDTSSRGCVTEQRAEQEGRLQALTKDRERPMGTRLWEKFLRPVVGFLPILEKPPKFQVCSW